MTWEMFINLQKPKREEKIFLHAKEIKKKILGSEDERSMESVQNETNQFGFCHLFEKIYFIWDIKLRCET